MQIQKITKLHNGLYALNLIDEAGKIEQVQLSEDVVIENNWYSNQMLTEEMVRLVRTLANYSKLTAQTLNYLAYKMRTEQEVSHYLDKKQCDLVNKQKIIEKMKKLNYINDERYIGLFVKQHFDLNKKGPLWIKNELTNKGISPALVTRAITSISEKEMEEKIVQIIESLERLNKTKTIKQLKNSIIRTLLTKGYQMDVILPVLNHYPFEAKPVNEEQLLQKELLKVVKRLKRKYNGYDLKTRVTSSLLTKGFEFEAIASAYGQLDEEIE